MEYLDGTSTALQDIRYLFEGDQATPYLDPEWQNNIYERANRIRQVYVSCIETLDQVLEYTRPNSPPLNISIKV